MPAILKRLSDVFASDSARKGVQMRLPFGLPVALPSTSTLKCHDQIPTLKTEALERNGTKMELYVINNPRLRMVLEKGNQLHCSIRLRIFSIFPLWL